MRFEGGGRLGQEASSHYPTRLKLSGERGMVASSGSKQYWKAEMGDNGWVGKGGGGERRWLRQEGKRCGDHGIRCGDRQ